MKCNSLIPGICYNHDLMIKGLFAVTLKTSNLQKLAKFYSDVVGLRIEKNSSDVIMLRLGDGQMLVIQEDEHIKPISEPQTQLRGAIAFQVENLEAVRKHLKDKKVKMDSVKKKGSGFEVITGFDPEGNRIDFVQTALSAG